MAYSGRDCGTPSLQQAYDPKLSVWVTASAGSGKTRLLTLRMAALLWQGTPGERIVCVTFTRKAAQEMRDRLTRLLQAWHQNTQWDMLREILGRHLTSEDCDRAAALWPQFLDTPPIIQTLHGFCHHLLRRFPLESGMPLPLTLWEPWQSAQAWSKAVETVLAGARYSSVLAPVCQRLLAYHPRLATWLKESRGNFERQPLVSPDSVLMSDGHAMHLLAHKRPPLPWVCQMSADVASKNFWECCMGVEQITPCRSCFFVSAVATESCTTVSAKTLSTCSTMRAFDVEGGYGQNGGNDRMNSKALEGVFARVPEKQHICTIEMAASPLSDLPIDPPQQNTACIQNGALRALASAQDADSMASNTLFLRHVQDTRIMGCGLKQHDQAKKTGRWHWGACGVSMENPHYCVPTRTTPQMMTYAGKKPAVSCALDQGLYHTSICTRTIFTNHIKQSFSEDSDVVKKMDIDQERACATHADEYLTGLPSDGDDAAVWHTLWAAAYTPAGSVPLCDWCAYWRNAVSKRCNFHKDWRAEEGMQEGQQELSTGDKAVHVWNGDLFYDAQKSDACKPQDMSIFFCLTPAYLKHVHATRGSGKIVFRHPQAAAWWQAEKAWLGQWQEARQTYAEALQRQDQQVISHAVKQAYEHIKNTSGAVDYGDLVAKALALWENPAVMGWVAYCVDSCVDHILLDEAQDTSAEQWLLLRRLMESILINPHKTLCVVGDPKQSIYSFQGADPEMFFAMHQFARAWIHAHGGVMVDVQLQTSFRSQPAILDWVNHVCAPLALTPEAFPRHTSAVASDQNTAGLVEVCQGFTDEQASVQYWTRRIAYAAGQTSFLNDRDPPIKSEASTSVGVEVGGAGLGCSLTAGLHTLSDILIVFARRTKSFYAFEQALNQLGWLDDTGARRAGATKECLLPEAGHDPVLYAYAHLCAWLHDPYHDATMMQVLRCFFPEVSWRLVHTLAYGRRGSLWRAWLAGGEKVPADAQVLWARVRDQLSMWHQVARDPSCTVLQVLNAVVYMYGAGEALARHYGMSSALDQAGKSVVYCRTQQMLALVEAHAGMPLCLLPQLLRMTASTKPMENRDGMALPTLPRVRLLTIHGAKGLQAPWVIVPDLAAPLGAITSEYWRLLYVACTRAETTLSLGILQATRGWAPHVLQCAEEILRPCTVMDRGHRVGTQEHGTHHEYHQYGHWWASHSLAAKGLTRWTTPGVGPNRNE